MFQNSKQTIFSQMVEGEKEQNELSIFENGISSHVYDVTNFQNHTTTTHMFLTTYSNSKRQHLNINCSTQQMTCLQSYSAAQKFGNDWFVIIISI